MYKKILFLLCVLIVSSNASAAVTYQFGSYNYGGWIYSSDNSTNYTYGMYEENQGQASSAGIWEKQQGQALNKNIYGHAYGCVFYQRVISFNSIV